MSLTTEQKRSAAARLAKEIFESVDKTADLDLDDLIAAVSSIDTAMDTQFISIPGAWGTKTIKQGLVDNLPEPFQSSSTAQEKAVALMVWALSEVGLL